MAHLPVADATALVVGNRMDPDAGYVGERLAQRGFELRRVWREDDVPRDLTDVEGLAEGGACLVLLGSEWSVAHPVLPDALERECALARSAARAGVPVLGLCYGAQILAHAHGGSVRTADRPEVGLVTVETLNGRLVPAGPWWAFHCDVLDVPAGAEVVARNGCGIQAFTLPGALGVQFHPEVTPAVLDGWLERLPAMAATSGRTREELVDLAISREAEARAAAHALVDDFLAAICLPQWSAAARSNP